MKNFVITVARGYGSGGKQIGTKLAEELGIKLIDKELLQMASIESGISEALFALADEKLKKRIFPALGRSIAKTGELLNPGDELFLTDENLFKYQAKILRLLAVSESYVVIGRAADFVLKSFPNVVSVNIQAPYEDCVRSIMERAKYERKDAEKAVKNTDKHRSDYYKYYTGRKWKDITNYDLCLNSERIGRDRCVQVIKEYVSIKLGIQMDKGDILLRH